MRFTFTFYLDRLGDVKNGISTSCYGATSGARSVGTFTIPVDVTKVRLKTTGLTAYFLEGTTVATPSINTTFDVN